MSSPLFLGFLVVIPVIICALLSLHVFTSWVGLGCLPLLCAFINEFLKVFFVVSTNSSITRMQQTGTNHLTVDVICLRMHARSLHTRTGETPHRINFWHLQPENPLVIIWSSLPRPLQRHVCTRDCLDPPSTPAPRGLRLSLRASLRMTV